MFNELFSFNLKINKIKTNKKNKKKLERRKRKINKKDLGCYMPFSPCKRRRASNSKGREAVERERASHILSICIHRVFLFEETMNTWVSTCQHTIHISKLPNSKLCNYSGICNRRFRRLGFKIQANANEVDNTQTVQEPQDVSEPKQSANTSFTSPPLDKDIKKVCLSHLK